MVSKDIFKRKVEEADQFKAKTDITTADYPSFSLDPNGSTGIYKKSDTEIAITINDTDAFNLKNGEIKMYDGGATPGSIISLFISGGALVYRGSSGTYTQLAPP